MTTPGLDRLSRLQRQPFGTNTATNRNAYGGTTGSQLRRLSEDYNQATRLLRRQARRGDAASALQAIKLREDAIGQGIQTGGIRQRDEYQAGILDRVAQMEEGAALREQAAGANRQIASEAMQEVQDRFDTRKGMEETGPPASAAPGVSERNMAALDLLEGSQSGDVGLEQRGWSSAQRLGVRDPSIALRGNRNLRYRKTLDSALGQAKSPAEVAALRERGVRYGITPADFDRRANWWEKNRKV